MKQTIDMRIRTILFSLAFAVWAAPAMAQIGTGATAGKEVDSAAEERSSTGAAPSAAAVGGGEPVPAHIGGGVQPAAGRGAGPESGTTSPGTRPAYDRPVTSTFRSGDRQHRPADRPAPPSADDPAFHPCEEISGRGAAFDEAESAKEVLVIEEFVRTRDVPVAYMMTLRDIVGRACVERGRHEVVDAASIPGLGGFSGSEVLYGAAVDPVSRQERRMAAIARSGARYVITGIVSEYKIAHARTGVDKKGFKSAIRLVLTGYDLATGTQLETRSYNLVGEGVKAEEADLAASNSLTGKMTYFLDNNFKFRTEILQVGAVNKRGKIKECYIHAGSRMGVRPGDLFLVYEIVPMRGVETRRLVGKLRAKRVDDTDSALCAIAKGGEEIARAMQAGDRLLVISDSQALFF